MSTQLPEAPSTPAQKAEAKRLSDRLITLCGLVLFFSGMVIARLLKHSDDPGLGDDLGDIFKSFGVVIASLGGALPVPDVLKRLLGAGGAKVLTMLVVGGLFSAGSLMGCAGSQYAAERKADLDWTPGPPCHIEVHLDGQRKPAVTVDAPEACEPAPDVCPVVPQS